MLSYMAKYQNKYISLKDASIISGYTLAELRNFCKIGLIGSKKVRNRVCIRFDAFDQLNEKRGAQNKSAGKAVSARLSQTGLLPFTTPSRALIKTLEPVALAAALVMALYIGMMPPVAGQIVGMFETSGNTLAYMGESAANLMETSSSYVSDLVVGTEAAVDALASANVKAVASVMDTLNPAVEMSGAVLAEFGGSTKGLMEKSVDLAYAVSESAGSIPAMRQPLAEARYLPQVAGVATHAEVVASNQPAADYFGQFRGFVSGVDKQIFYSLVDSLRFENLDNSITNTFHW